MSSSKYYTILTDIGKAKIANAIAYGRRVELTTFALGDGDGAPYDPDESQTALKREVYRANVSNVVIADDAINMLEVNMAVPANVGGWIVREMGIYDADGDLIAISKTPDDPKPSAGSGAAKDVIYRLFIVVTNTSAVEIKIDPTVAVATKAEVEAVAEQVRQLKIRVATLEGTVANHAITISELNTYGAIVIADDGTRYRWGVSDGIVYLEPLGDPPGVMAVMLDLGKDPQASFYMDVGGDTKSIDNAVNSDDKLSEGKYNFDIL